MTRLNLKKTVTALALSLGAMVIVHAEAPHAHWGYEGDVNPEKWGELAPDYATCKSGRNQSPVNIDRSYNAPLDALGLHYAAVAADVIDNGHTVQVTPQSESSYLQLAGARYTLKQFHFHAPSENQIKGKSFPLEGHFVHADKDGNLLVLAVMFKVGKQNPQLDGVLNALGGSAGESRKLERLVNAAALLPKQRGYYRFAGSLTTPPCSEGVTWIVLKTPMTLSQAQLDRFAAHLQHNNRPVQPLNGRVIVD